MSVANARTTMWYSQEGKRVRKKVGRQSTGRLIDGGPRRGGVAAVVAAVACLAMTLFAAPALASWGIETSFGKGSVPVGVAVDESGNVFASYLFGQSEEFNAFGQVVSPPSPFGDNFVSGVAVNPASNNLYIVNAEGQSVLVYALNPSTSEEELKRYFSIAGTGNLLCAYTAVQIATDGHGNVYVPDAPGNKIEVFNEEGGAPEGGVAPEIQGSGPEALARPEGVAIAANGNVWVADSGDNRIEEFKPDGTFVKEITDDAMGVRAVAVDARGDLFAAIGGATPHIVEYDEAGQPISGAENIGEGVLSENEELGEGILDGIAFDGPRETLYAANSGGNDIVRFDNLATVASKAPSNLKEGEATLNGEIEEVEPGATILCRFEYGPTTAYGNTAPCTPDGPYAANTFVSASVKGLSGDTDYRVALANAEGEYVTFGKDEALGPPAVDSASADAEVTTATVRAYVTVLEEGASTCHVEYGPTTGYGASAPCRRSVSSAPGEHTVETPPINGLKDNSTYHYRLVTEDAHFGMVAGPDQEFTTFGIESFAFEALGAPPASETATQAGAHPYQLTDTFRLNTSTHVFSNGATDPLAPDANAKDVITALPPGLIGNPDATPRCTPYEVVHQACGGAAQVGELALYTATPPSSASSDELQRHKEAPLYNVTPPKGIAAEFSANIAKLADVRIDARVRTGEDYGVTAEVLNSSADEGLVKAEVTLWGVPASGSHDKHRYCPEGPGLVSNCGEHGALMAFLRNPTACTGPREAHMTVEPWQEDEPPVVVGASAKMPPITGCREVPFTPEIKVTPESSVSDSPTGLHVELTVPQQENPNKLAEADLKDAKVVLPAGMTVNPSSANGLAGCPLLSGKEGHPGVSGIDLENGEAANCPNAAKVGTVAIKSPLLEEEVKGGVYVAQQNANPFKSLLALYISAEAPERGVVVKLAGHVEANPVTGQLTTTFDENPQLPFETLNLDFFGGARAALATPQTCGSYTATSVLEPWSHMEANGTPTGTPDATPYSEFKIDSGCTDAFAPSFAAGTDANKAAIYSQFVMNLTRKDGEQVFKQVAMTLPAGISGMISHVTPCPEAQANAGTCPASAKIGHVLTEAGVGSEPVSLPEAGKPEDPVFLTEKYDGAPFGLSIVVPAEAGPFNLGTVVVRARIEVNPTTAQVSVITDASGPHAMPTILDGIPVDIKAIHVEIDRPEFMFNPTDCNAMAVAGTIGSAEGASAAVSSHFQAASCASLPFKPKFSALIHAHHSRKGGEYLHVVVQSAFGQANIHQVHVQLPGKLPSRLETLKLACTEAQFAANPAGCPAGSFVGHAIAHTPILPVAMQGPAIFVSHGGKGFPNLDLVLQGDGVSITLVGDTYINKKSITTSTFKSVPDVPIGRFDLVLPAGPHSALAGNGNMCAKPLYMPTTLTGQNGAVIKRRTKVQVTGCRPELHVVKTRRHGARARIVVQVPSAGKLVADGAGIGRDVEKTKTAERVALTVRLKRHVRRMLREHHNRRIKVTVRLRFHPRHGRAIKSHVSVLMR